MKVRNYHVLRRDLSDRARACLAILARYGAFNRPVVFEKIQLDNWFADGNAIAALNELIRADCIEVHPVGDLLAFAILPDGDGWIEYLERPTQTVAPAKKAKRQRRSQHEVH